MGLAQGLKGFAGFVGCMCISIHVCIYVYIYTYICRYAYLARLMDYEVLCRVDSATYYLYVNSLYECAPRSIPQVTAINPKR